MIYGKIISVDSTKANGGDSISVINFNDIANPSVVGQMRLTNKQIPDSNPMAGDYLASCDEGRCAAAHRVVFGKGVYHSWFGKNMLIWSDATMTGTLCAMRNCRCKCDGGLFKTMKEVAR